MKPTEKKTMPVGKESIAKVSKKALSVELGGVSKKQKSILEHSEGIRSKTSKKIKKK